MFNANTQANMLPISQEVLNAERSWLGEGIDLELDFQIFPRVSILPYRHEFETLYEGIIVADDGHIQFTLFAYGGKELLNRITFFVNHQPIQFEGYDFIEIQMLDGKMLKLDVSFTVGDLESFNSLYAIMATAEPSEAIETIFKTPTLLLVNE